MRVHVAAHVPVHPQPVVAGGQLAAHDGLHLHHGHGRAGGGGGRRRGGGGGRGRGGGCGRGVACRAEVQLDVRRRPARERVPVVVVDGVRAGARHLAGGAGARRAGRVRRLEVHARVGERAVVGGAVDVADVVPDEAAGQRVLELSDGAAVVERGAPAKLERDAAAG